MYDHHRDWDRYLDVNNFWVVSKDDDQGGSSVTALPLLLTVAIALHVLCRSLPLSSPSPFFCERPLYGCCTVPQSQEDPKILERGPYMAAETALKIARPAINVCSRLIHFFTIISFTRLDIWNFQDLIFDISKIGGEKLENAAENWFAAQSASPVQVLIFKFKLSNQIKSI